MNSPDIIAKQQAEQLLLTGAGRGNVEDVTRALQSGASPNARTWGKPSALTMAAGSDFIGVAKLLIAAGANVNQRDILSVSDIRTALSTAIYNQNFEMAALLISKGADPRLTNSGGQNAALLLISVGAFDPDLAESDRDASLALLERMLKTEGVVNQPDSDGDTPLLLSLRQTTDPRATKLLLSRGADPELRANSGGSAMHRNWHPRDFSRLHMLLEHGANINSRDRNGASALSYATGADAVNELVRLGADINHLDNMGRNALAIILDSWHVLAAAPNSLNPRMTPFNPWPSQALSVEESKCLIGLGIDTAHVDHTGASVESRLLAIQNPESAELLALIGARKAKESMTNIVQTARTRPR